MLNFLNGTGIYVCRDVKLQTDVKFQMRNNNESHLLAKIFSSF